MSFFEAKPIFGSLVSQVVLSPQNELPFGRQYALGRDRTLAAFKGWAVSSLKRDTPDEIQGQH